MLSTELTQTFGLKHPIVSAPTAVLMMFERLANSHNGRTNPRRLAR